MSQHFEIQSLISSFIWADRVLLHDEVVTSLYDYFISLISSTQNLIKDGLRQNKRYSNHIHVVSYQVIIITFVTVVVVASYLISWIIRLAMNGWWRLCVVLNLIYSHLFGFCWPDMFYIVVPIQKPDSTRNFHS